MIFFFPEAFWNLRGETKENVCPYKDLKSVVYNEKFSFFETSDWVHFQLS